MATEKCIVLHPFSDLSRAKPLYFVCTLKNYLTNSEEFKNVGALRQVIIEALPGVPPPGPFTFLLHCLNVLYFLYEERCCGVLWHFLASLLWPLDELSSTLVDHSESRKLAAKLIRGALGSVSVCTTGVLRINEHIFVKLATFFKIENNELEEVARTLRLHPKISEAIREKVSRSLPSSQAGDGDMEKKVRIFAGKGCWNIAVNIAEKLPELVDFLVNLALEMGNAEKAAEICTRCCKTTFSSPTVGEMPACSTTFCTVTVPKMHAGSTTFGLPTVPKMPVRVPEIRTLQLEEFISEEKVIWVDTKDVLTEAKMHFGEVEVEVVGIDSEWIETNSQSRKYKVSILQIATEEKVFIFDMLKLSRTEPDALNDCLTPMFHSPRVWKVGYALNNDLNHLYTSYEYLECFSDICTPTLDFQRIYADLRGGLSGVAEELLNGRLDKSNQMSDWGQRPLSRSQMQYAALDAVVLIAMFKVALKRLGREYLESMLRRWP